MGDKTGPESATGSCKREGNGNFFLHLISLGISGAEKVVRHVRQNSANCKDDDEGEHDEQSPGKTQGGGEIGR